MSYNYAESATLTAATDSSYVIASDALMTTTPDYKILTLSGGATYNGATTTIISGGTVTVGRNATLSNATVGNNGTVFVSSAGKFYGGTIKSGGYVTAAAGQNFPVFSNFTVEAGGILHLGNGTIYGRNNTVAVSGFKNGNLANSSASVNGVLYGVLQKGGAFNYYDIVFSNFTNSGGFTYMLSGCSILDGQAIKAGGGFGLGSNCYLYNANVTLGSVWIQNSNTPISLGGANTNITKGHVYHCAAAGTTNQDTNLYAANGVLYGVTLKTNGNWLRDLTIVSGLTISAPEVNDTGKLTLAQGGIAANASVVDGGSIEVRSGGTATGITATDGATVLLAIAPNTVAQGTKNGSAFNVTGPSVDGFEANNNTWVIVSSGGTAGNLTVNAGAFAVFSSAGRGSGVTVNQGGWATVSSAANVSGLTLAGGSAIMREATVSSLVVQNGGWMSAATAGASYWGITVESGGSLLFRATTFTGDINVKAGTIGGFGWVTSDSIDGAAYGMGQNAGAFHFRNAKLVNFVNSGACYTYLSSGAVVSNGSAIVAKGGYAMCTSGYLYNAYITDGWIWLHDPGMTVSLGGADTYIAQGHLYHCNAGASSYQDTNFYAENGVIHSATIKIDGANGRYMRSLKVLEGLTITESVVSSGGKLTIGSGGSATGVTVIANGSFVGESGGSATDITLAAGANLVVGIASDTKLQGTSNGVAFDFEGPSVSDFTLTSGVAFHVSSGGTASNIILSAGNLSSDFVVVSSGGLLDGVNIYGDKTSNQYPLRVYGGGVASNVHHSGAGLWVYGDGIVKEVRNEAGETVLQDNAYASDVIISGTSGAALLYVRNSALVENLYMSQGGARFNKGTIRNATFEGSVDQLAIASDFLIESASFLNGAVMYVSAGGSLNSATVNSHAVVGVSNGGKATNVVVSGNDWDGRLRIYNGGYASGVTVSGTDGTKNYVSMFEGNGVLEDVTADKAGVYLAGGGIIRNVTQKNGALVILRGENPYASGANVYGGTLYFQNGAKGQDIVVSGGQMQVVDDGYSGAIKGSGAKVSRVDLVTGAILVSAGGTLLDARISGGLVQVASTGSTYGVPLVSGATLTGGTLRMSGAALSSIKIVGGGAVNVSGGTVTDFDIETPNLGTGSQFNVSANAVVSGGRVNGKNKIGVVNLTGGAKFNEAYISGGTTFLSGLAEITNVEQTGGAVILRGEDAYASGAEVLGGEFYFQNGAKGDDILVAGGTLQAYDTNMTNPAGSGEVVNDVTMTAGSIGIGAGATFNRITAIDGTINITSGVANTVTVTGGSLMVYGGGTANDVTITENGSAIVSGVVNVNSDATAWNVQVNNGGTANVTSGGLINAKTNTGATINFTENKSFATFAGDDTDIAEGTLYFNGSAVAGHATDGVLEGFNAGGATVGYKLSIGSGIVLKDAVGNNTAVRVSAFDGAVVSGMTLRGGAIICANNNNVSILDTTLTGNSTTCNLNLSAGAYASNTVVQKGGRIQFQHADAKADNTTIMAGGSMVMTTAADTGDLVTLDFTGTTGNQTVYITDLAKVKADTEIVLKGETAGNTYTIATSGSTEKYVNCGEWGLYDDSIKAGESITNAFTGMTYDFNAAGTAIAVSAFAAATQEAAGSIESGTTINGNGKAAKWTSATSATGTIKAATSAIAGDAWLEIDGTNLSGTTLYGAEIGYTGNVNLYATGDAVINNLAAGAVSSGSVAGVKLTVDSATVGLAYAGGFGTVTGYTETLIGEGATIQKDFYAGALANYAKTGATTSAGDVALTIEAGTFSGNIYGAASVKAGSATSLVHSVGNVTIDVKGGETTKGAQACLFAGGYATGTATSDNAVYTVGDIDVTIDGGNWGAVAGGRGIFGGAFASKVTAAAQNVSLTINGGSFGNIYGGGWSQQGGASIVGDVDIDITGGTIANIFGGGTHSTTGGTTTVDDVTINVSGGNITGAIYARGQADGDVVSGDEVSVTFTGDTNFGCGVYGYSYVGGAASDAVLSFTAYTGTFSGAVGGFDSIVFDDDTAMTLTTAVADVANGKWEFDFTDRADTLSGTSFLTWNEADFAGDTVKVNFTDATQAAAGWSIADAAFTGASFTLAIGGTDVTTVAYDTAIADGDWAGWKFTDDNGTLKFKQLA